MSRMRFAFVILLATSILPAAPAAAGPFYLTGRLLDSSIDPDLGEASRRIAGRDDDGFGAGLGLKLGRYLAVQAEYHDLGLVRGTGTSCPDPTFPCIVDLPFEADTTGVSLSVLPQLPLSEELTIYGKLGMVEWESEVTEIADFGPVRRRRAGSFEEDDLLLGAGLRFALPGPVGLFAEYEKAADTFETISLGVTLGY